jgi:catechol 2,3-dioxygenase-like lactoylglutathione lyase family enzyme
MATEGKTSLAHSKVMAFVSTCDPARAKAFYRDTVGLNFVSEDPFAIVFDAFGTMLRVSIVQEHTPAGHTVLGWDVADIAATVTELAKAGAKFERYDVLPQDELGIWMSPGGHKVAWFKDPDGNTLSVTQFARS